LFTLLARKWSGISLWAQTVFREQHCAFSSLSLSAGGGITRWRGIKSHYASYLQPRACCRDEILLYIPFFREQNFLYSHQSRLRRHRKIWEPLAGDVIVICQQPTKPLLTLFYSHRQMEQRQVVLLVKYGKIPHFCSTGHQISGRVRQL
jgi:hypothetical protein